jgi:NADPH:quinone reductase-like Zn-dependent oxidoreductase
MRAVVITRHGGSGGAGGPRAPRSVAWAGRGAHRGAGRAGAQGASPGQLGVLDLDEGVDYTHAGWWRDLAPVDLVLDAIGGRSLRRSYRLLRPGGRLVAFGASSVLRGERRDLRRAAPEMLAMLRGFNLIRQTEESKAVIGLNMLALWDERGSLEPWIAPLRSRIDAGVVRPVIAAEVPFDEAPEAHRILAERRNVGKVVLVP